MANVAQAAVRRNQKCLDADGNQYSPFVIGIWSITILIQFFPFLKCVYIFWNPLCVCVCVCVCVCLYIYINTHTHTFIH
jgi:hypothetical protein